MGSKIGQVLVFFLLYYVYFLFPRVQYEKIFVAKLFKGNLKYVLIEVPTKFATLT